MGNRNFNFNWEFKNFAIRTVHENWEDRNSPLRKNCPVELIKYFDEKHSSCYVVAWFELDEEGFVTFQPVEAGVTQWFNRNLKDFETYNYSNNYFINFIKKVEICNNKEYKF